MMKTLFEKEADLFSHKKKRQKEKEKRQAQKQREEKKNLREAVKKIPAVLQELAENDEKFARYIARAPSAKYFFSNQKKYLENLIPKDSLAKLFPNNNRSKAIKAQPKQKNSAVVLAEHKFYASWIDRHLCYEILLITQDGRQEVGVYEYKYMAHGYQWVQHEIDDEPAIERMILKLSRKETALSVLFKYRPPRGAR